MMGDGSDKDKESSDESDEIVHVNRHEQKTNNTKQSVRISEVESLPSLDVDNDKTKVPAIGKDPEVKAKINALL